MLNQLMTKSSAKQAAERLYLSASAQARAESLYREMGTPDTVEGRFELLTLHVILLVDRLGEESGSVAAEMRQALFDVYLSNLDGALREMGVGDLAVGKRMRKLGEAFYGRASALRAALSVLPDCAPLRSLLARTALQARPDMPPDRLAAYVQQCRNDLARCDREVLLSGSPTWSPG